MTLSRLSQALAEFVFDQYHDRIPATYGYVVRNLHPFGLLPSNYDAAEFRELLADVSNVTAREKDLKEKVESLHPVVTDADKKERATAALEFVSWSTMSCKCFKRLFLLFRPTRC